MTSTVLSFEMAQDASVDAEPPGRPTGVVAVPPSVAHARSADAPDPKRNRVRTGCFCCRKRKKKCDERQPACVACMRNMIRCVYPTMKNEPLPADFRLEQTRYDSAPLRRLKRRRSKSDHPALSADAESEIALELNQSLFRVLIVNPAPPKAHSDNTKAKSGLESIFELDPKTPCSPATTAEPGPESASPGSSSPVDNLDDFLVVSEPLAPQSPLSDSTLISYSKYTPNVILSEQDSELYHTFIVKFIPTISLPHSHPLLSPNHIWASMGKQSHILADIFLCCGASYLSNAYKISGTTDKSSYFEFLAEKKYHQALKSLGNAINAKSVDIDSDWLIVAGLTLCLRDRSYGLNGSRCAKHLTFVYNLLERRFSQKSLVAADPLEYVTLKESVMEMSVSPSSNRLPSIITPTEKLLMDSFVFNYSVTMLCCSKWDLVSLPSPYSFFPKIKEWLNCPIYRDCDVSWMNNPVLGSALESFEVSAKLTWLLRLHFEDDFGTVSDKEGRLQMNNEKFWNLILPLKKEIEVIEEKLEFYKLELSTLKDSRDHIIPYKDLRSNLSVAIVVLNSSKILYEKLINPIIPCYVPAIQKPLDAAFSEFENAGCASACLSSLSLFIMGIATTDISRRQYLTKMLEECSVALASNVGSNVSKMLTSSWGKEDFDKNILELGDQGYKSFDLIFDRESIERLAF